MQSDNPTRTFVKSIGFDPAYFRTFEDKLFIAGPKSGRRFVNFFVLLLLATVIATYGVLSGSVATVIGAMIVAPLMGPIMATAAAVVMGSSTRAFRSLALVAAGVGSVIALSYLLTITVPDVVISYVDNRELASRIQPDLLALLTALASGAAGAYITMREEIADSMGGVAIAISLVPPLCVVGISLNQGELGAAGGAMMLFMTNFLAILLAGGAVFLLSGLGRLANADGSRQLRRNAFIMIAIATGLVAVPLSITSYQAFHQAHEEETASHEVEAWLAGTEQELLAVTVRGPRVLVTVVGSGELHPLRELANQLADSLERPVLVDVRMVPTMSESSDAGE